MPATIVVGGQYGSEGKGKVAFFLARMQQATVAVRVGGPNSGHTVWLDGAPLALRHLPTASLLPDVLCVLGPGSYLDPEVLLAEIDVTGISPDRVVIDRRALIVTSADRDAEHCDGLQGAIGSTLSGTGAAVRRRAARSSDVRFAGDDPRLAPFVGDTMPLLRARLDAQERIVLEGTQGYGLSLLHGERYPFVTSRDTTAAACLSEAGLSPFDADQVVLVLRAFPIRVAGNSGPLAREIDWSIVAEEAGIEHAIQERTTVTQRVRRVARFDPAVVRRAISANRPTSIVMNHLDHVDALASPGRMTAKVIAFLSDVQRSIGAQIDFVGMSADSLEAVRQPETARRSYLSPVES